jgi:demethylmenaquinone methyltransferase/2-methoxy-6-polyprenyl-1,4-benzoquinol methylase/phosphoethanolamine N-methyltransferase
MSRVHHSLHGVSASAPHTQGRTIRWARRYDLFVFLFTLGQARRLRSRTADLAQLVQGEAVLDVGCGTGDLTLELAHRVGSGGLVAGIDAAPEMVARACQKAGRQHLAIDFRVEPVERLSFADQTFDVVVSSLVFHHLPDALKRQALAEIRRVLKPGGRLLLVDLLGPTPAFLLHSHLQTTLADLLPLVGEAGFLQVEWQRGPFPALGFLRARTAP